MEKYKLFLASLMTLISLNLGAQENPNETEKKDSITMFLNLAPVYTSKYFQQEYDRQLEKLRRVYPMALRAKAILNEYEAEMSKIDKKRKQTKYSKETHERLKEQFTYTIRDLYTSEGVMLMQLIHRETGMTVSEIIKKYRGGIQSVIYTGMGNIFEQDLNAKYDPKGVNAVTEIVIQDILAGYVAFNPEMDVLTKEEFKKTQADYRARRKVSKKRMKDFKNEKRRADRLAKKAEREKSKKTKGR